MGHLCNSFTVSFGSTTCSRCILSTADCTETKESFCDGRVVTLAKKDKNPYLAKKNIYKWKADVEDTAFFDHLRHVKSCAAPAYLKYFESLPNKCESNAEEDPLACAEKIIKLHQPSQTECPQINDYFGCMRHIARNRYPNNST